MANPLYGQYGAPQNPFAQIIDQVKQMQNSIPNPKAEVEKLMRSGQMSQQQFNQLSQVANQIFPHIK
jgi:BMFP domain-containing protein YqiC